MSLWEAALLGAVQGLTEFLPISSTAHLLAVRQALGHPNPNDAFTTVVQLGTLAAVVWYFRADVAALTRATLRDLPARKLGSSPQSRLAWLIVLGTVPAVVVGGLYKAELKANFYNLTAMAWVAIVFALLMTAAELWAWRRRRAGKPEVGEGEVGWAVALWVGVWQALALMPGASRSGTTITAGLFAGLSRPAAARFSFLLSLPSILAAGAKELYDEWGKLLGEQAAPLAVGLVVSAVVGYGAIAWLLHFLKRYSTAVFVVYRLALGAAILLAIRWGYLAAS